MKFKQFGFVFIISMFFWDCSNPEKHIEISVDHFHSSIDKVVEIMVHDIFSPPVASRVFAYPNIAAYEILSGQSAELKSLKDVLTDFEPIPKSKEDVNAKLSALIAHMELSKSLVFSEEMMQVVQDSLYSVWEEINKREFDISKAYAMQVVAQIKEWMDGDNYKQTRTLSKFVVNSKDPSRWQPTPPNYMEGIEPHWSEIRPFLLDSSEQFKPKKHPEFSLNKKSKFYGELMEVYNTGKRITIEGDESEEIQIAKFWDCNPFVSVSRGHFMFATKKISPGAHWIGITKIAAKKANLNVVQTVNVYTKVSLAIADGFISCWDEKYRSNLIRPETLINKYVDSDWLPILQTPPFPEYTSGHSVVSGAASVILTELFGDDYSFKDDTEIPYGLPIRKFDSFYHASSEAAMSRMYGGIHYRAAIENGLDQGKKLGRFVAKKLEN